jgi:hypothetical protein
MAEDFHSLCDDLGPTITLLQIKDGDCIGGFTNVEWTSPEERKRETDASAVLFNLTTHTSFTCRRPELAVVSFKDRGPYFGDFAELSPFYEPFNKENACLSMTHNTCYFIPQNSEGINELTNQKCNELGLCTFTITEIEVWGVKFKE